METTEKWDSDFDNKDDPPDPGGKIEVPFPANENEDESKTSGVILKPPSNCVFRQKIAL